MVCPMGSSLDGRRVLVVGASAGIGRSFAVRAIRTGADVIVAARRVNRLESLVAEAGPCLAVPVDLARPDGFEDLAAAVSDGDPLDLVVSTAGSAPLRYVADTTPDDWAHVLGTNVGGFNELVRTVLPHLHRSAVVAAVSSETVDQPREGLAAYGASKAALEASIRGWRTEHPERRFTCIRVGATQPTEFGAGFDGELLGPILDQWVLRGLLQERFMATDDVAAVLVDTLAVIVAHPGVAMEDMVLRSPSAVVGSALPAIGGTA
jgi:NAD(P)-dependent dehydrogenase (short-subunit alcohol dehydrogenase family)